MPSSGISRHSTARSDAVLDEHRARRRVARACRWSTPRSARCCACSRPPIGAARILEIGTAIGYSGIWLAGALPPDGMLLTMELDAERAQEARENFARAGLADRVSVIVGDAQLMIAKVAGPFDLIFQDGDKPLYEPLLDRLVELLRPGGLLVTDNVLWDGEVVPGFSDASAAGSGRHARDRRIQRAAQRAIRSCMTAIVPLRDGVAISVKTVRLKPALRTDAIAVGRLRTDEDR